MLNAKIDSTLSINLEYIINTFDPYLLSQKCQQIHSWCCDVICEVIQNQSNNQFRNCANHRQSSKWTSWFTFLYNEVSTFSSSHIYNTLLDITYFQPTYMASGTSILHTRWSIDSSQQKSVQNNAKEESVFWATMQFKCKSKRKVDESSTSSHVLRNHHHL